jgi:hypothetical protein
MNPPETAPRDGSVFLAAVGWPWLLPCMWCEVSARWAVATPQACGTGTDVDRWWECDYETDEALTGWLPMPENATALP